MKKTLHLFLLLCLSIYNQSLQSQPYLPVLQENINWALLQVALSPNPFTESTSITITGLSQRAIYFSLYGPRGRLLRREQLLSPSFEFKRGALPSGLYFYRIESERKVLASGGVVAR